MKTHAAQANTVSVMAHRGKKKQKKLELPFSVPKCIMIDFFQDD